MVYMIQECTSGSDQAFLIELSSSVVYFITLLPIYTVGVQVRGEPGGEELFLIFFKILG